MRSDDWSQRLQVQLLGPVEVTLDGEVCRVGGPKRRALLARLALDPGAVVSADVLLRDLWAGRPPTAGSTTLHSHVAHLRRDLGSAGPAVVTVSPGYSLRVDEGSVDTVAFERAVQAARSTDDPDAVSAHVAAARRLWRGRPLVEFEDSGWAVGVRARLDELRLEAEERDAAAQLTRGRHAALVPRLEELTEAHPLHERFWLHLVEALRGCGRHAEALRAAQRFRAGLAEIGLSPSPDLARLEGAVLRHGPLARESRTRGRGPQPAHMPAAGFDLVGRDRERRTLESLLDEVESEGQRTVLLSGEAGVGKSRLVQSVVAQVAARRGLALQGRCDDALAVPFQPVVEALSSFVAQLNDDAAATNGADLTTVLGRHPEELARVVPEVKAALPDLPSPASADPEVTQHRFFGAVDDWLSAVSQGRPVVLVVEDVHWASRPTLLLLRHILRAPSTRSLLVLVTHREPEPWRAAGAPGWLAAVRRQPNAVHMPLKGLDAAAVERLVEEAYRAHGSPAGAGPRQDLGALAAEVHRLTRGNALLVVELLRHLSEVGGAGLRQTFMDTGSLARLEVPASVRLLVRDRIERLDDEAAVTVQRAAVLGIDVDLRVLRASSDLDDERLAEVLDGLTAAHFLEPGRAGAFTCRFPHALVRDAVLHDLSDLRLALLHRDAAQALEAGHGGDPERNLDKLAAHFTAAAPLVGASKAVDYAIRAGHQALTEGAADESLAHFATALTLMERHDVDDDTARCEALLGRGEAQRRVDQPHLRQTFLDAATIARDLGDVDRLARAAKGISRGFLLTIAEAHDPERIELISSALDALGESPSPQRALLLASLAGEVRFAGDVERSHALVADAVHVARRTGSGTLLVRALATQWDVLFHPRTLPERSAISAELAALARDCVDPALRLRIALARFADALERGDRDAAGGAVTELQQLGRDRLPPASSWIVPMAGATWELVQGGLDQAEVLATRAREMGSAHGDLAAEMAYLSQLFQIRRHQGRLDEIDESVRLIAAQVPGARAAYAYLCQEIGRPDEAMSVVAELVDTALGSLPQDVSWPFAMALLSETVVRLGDAGRAAAVELELVAVPGQNLAHFVYFFGPVAYHVGILRAAQGDRHGAATWLARAEESASAFGATAYQALARRHRQALQGGR